MTIKIITYRLKWFSFFLVHIMPLVIEPVSSCLAVLVGISTRGELGKKKPLTSLWIPVSFRWMPLVLISKSLSCFLFNIMHLTKSVETNYNPVKQSIFFLTKSLLCIIILIFFSWRAIMDNLMTHDKTTFRDLMSEYYEMT